MRRPQPAPPPPHATAFCMGPDFPPSHSQSILSMQKSRVPPPSGTVAASRERQSLSLAQTRVKSTVICRARSLGRFKKNRNCSSRRKEAHFEENQWNRASLRRLLRILESALGHVESEILSVASRRQPWYYSVRNCQQSAYGYAPIHS